MSKIYNDLYLGNIKVSQNMVFFEKNQIQNVLIAAQGLKRCFKEKKYFQINVIDSEDELIIKKWPACMQFLHQSIGNTLVHCLGGVSRSASTVIAYAMFKENLTCDKATKKIFKLHDDANPNTGFMKQLEFWEEILSNYRKAIGFGKNENFKLLEEMTNQFIDVQQKRIAYHLRICLENKRSKRSKRDLIGESIQDNPIDSYIDGTTKCVGSTKKNQFSKFQEDYENQFKNLKENEEQEEEVEEEKKKEKEDYDYIFDEQQENNNCYKDDKETDQEDYEICFHEQELQVQQEKLRQQKEQSKRNEKFDNMLKKLEIEKQSQQMKENDDIQDAKEERPKEQSNEQWFYQNVKQVSKRKHKKAQNNNTVY